MGSLLVYQPRERHTHRVKKMLKFALSTFVIVGLATGYPQGYGGVQPAPSRQVSSSSIQCRTEYATIYDTTYQETETQECVTKYDNVCKTTFERQCQPTTRQECNTVYEKQCKTIYKNNPYDECKDVTKTKANQVAYPVCNDVPEQLCKDVPRQVCVQVPDQVCRNQPLEQCSQVPRQECFAKHKKVPIRVSKRVPKKVCDEGYGSNPGLPETFDLRENQPSHKTQSNNQKIVFGH